MIRAYGTHRLLLLLQLRLSRTPPLRRPLSSGVDANEVEEAEVEETEAQAEVKEPIFKLSPTKMRPIPAEIVKHRQKGGPIDQLFAEMEKSAEVYSSMICNLLKFPTPHSLGEVKLLLKEMSDKKLRPSPTAFIYMLQSPLARQEEERQAIWQHMRKAGIRPTVEAYNALLGQIGASVQAQN